MTDWAKYAYESWLFPEMGEQRPLRHSTQVATVVGQFCEQYMMHLLGGEKDNSLIAFGVEPDLVFRMNGTVNFDILLESKGMAREYGVHITHDQVLRYIGITANEFPLTRPRVFYAFCIHNLRQMAKVYDTENALIEALSQNYLGTVILPLEILHTLLSWLPRRPNYGWNTPCKDHDWLTCITGPQLHGVLTGDTDIVEWLVGKAKVAEDQKRAMKVPNWKQYYVIRWRTPQVRMHGFLVDEAWMCAMLPASNRTPRANELVEEYWTRCNVCGRRQCVCMYKGETPPKVQTLMCLKCDYETLHLTEEESDG